MIHLSANRGCNIPGMFCRRKKSDIKEQSKEISTGERFTVLSNKQFTLAARRYAE